jgi:hypothetical protein
MTAEKIESRTIINDDICLLFFLLYYYLLVQLKAAKLKSRYGAGNRFQEPSLELSSQATIGWRPGAAILEQSMGARNRVGVGLTPLPSHGQLILRNFSPYF